MIEKWDYIIRFKKESIPSIAVKNEAIPEKHKVGHAEFINGIDYKEHKINLLRFWEKKLYRP